MAEPAAKKTKKISPLFPDWSQLPEELLHFICKNLKEDNCFDVVHARSVCTLWRSAFPFPSSLLRQSYSLPTFPPSESKELCTYEKVPLFLFRLPAPHANAAEYFMGGIGRDESEEDHMELLLPSPLQCSVKVKIPGSNPTLLKMLDCQIISLGHQYSTIGKEYKRMVFLPLDKDRGGDFVVVVPCRSCLLVLTSAEMRWKRLEGVPTSYCKNLITFKGRFYANFLSRQIFVIDPYSLEVTLLLPSPRELASYLVPSGNDELFLVKATFPPFAADVSRFPCRVSRLDEETSTWAEVSDLGDRVFFITHHFGNVSCSAKELPHGCGLTGNSILFTNLRGNVTYAFKYGVHTGNAEDDLNCWRSSRENRVVKLKTYFPVMTLRVER